MPWISLLGAVAALAPPTPPAAPSTELVAAFRQVCIEPLSHAVMLDHATARGWVTLQPDDARDLAEWNRNVSIEGVRQRGVMGQTAIMVLSRAGDTSFCRVYFRPAEPSLIVEALQSEIVLGSPLGRSDFAGRLTFPENTQAIGWHRSVGEDWRAVHYSFAADPTLAGAWQQIEITRPIR
jgi:hypothetical protein